MRLIRQALGAVGAVGATLGMVALVTLAITINLVITHDLNLPNIGPTWW